MEVRVILFAWHITNAATG